MIPCGMERLTIFSLVDKAGYADDFVLRLLDALRGESGRLLLVCRSSLHESTKATLEKIVDETIINDDPKEHNYAVAWKNSGVAFEADETVMLSSVFFGPLYPLREMFEDMGKRGLDFWTLTPHGFSDRYPYPYTALPDISEQSHMSFAVFGKKITMSSDFADFWDALPPPGIKSEEATEKAEILDDVMGYFAQRGYTGAPYIEPAAEDCLNPFHLLYTPKLLLEKYRCPLFDIRVFTVPKERILENTFGETARDFLEAIERCVQYDTGLIWKYLIRAAHPCDFVNALGLIYVLPTAVHVSGEDPFDGNGLRVALCMHLYYMDLLEDSITYAKNSPPQMDIFITTTSEEKKRMIEKGFAVLPNRVEVRLAENRGRNESAMLVCMADVAKTYDYICFYHDKKTTMIEPASIGRGNAYKFEQCTLPSAEFALNTIDLLQKNPRLGFLTATEPNHAYFSMTPGNEWAGDFQNTLRLYNELGLTAPISEDKYPVASYGSVFWFRCAALKRLFEREWRYEEFPEEPVGEDMSLLHAIERIYPYVCQSEGFIPAYLMSDRAAEYEILNLRESLRMVNIFAKQHEAEGSLGAVLSHFDYQLQRGENALAKLDGAGEVGMGAFLKAKAMAVSRRNGRGRRRGRSVRDDKG